MENNETQKNYYAIIPANVRYDKDITPNAKLLYGEITALCNERGYCWSENSYFANLYGVSQTSISKWISILVQKGYIASQIVYKEGTKQIHKRYLRIVNDPIEEKLNTPIEEKLKENNTRNNNTKNNTVKKKIKKEISESVLLVWEHWKSKTIFPRESLTEEKQKAIENKLKSYSADVIKQTIDRYATVIFDSEYYFNTKWYIEAFFSQKNAFPHFLEDGQKWVNYQQSASGSYKKSSEDVDEFAEQRKKWGDLGDCV